MTEKGKSAYDLREIGLFCLMLGLVLSMLGALISSWAVILVGIFIFFLCIPLFILHFFRSWLKR